MEEILLIEAIKKYEILYNKSSPYHRNKSKRAAAWSAISKEANLPEDVCQTRWRYLRDKFVKKISESHRASGCGAVIVEGHWQSRMEFLREHIKPRKTVKSLSKESSPTEILEKNRSESVESMPETLFSEIKFVYDPLSPIISTTTPIEVPSPSRKAMEEKLIEAIKNHEILYNKSSLFYGNKSQRAAAWSAISKEVNFPEDVCRTRWRCLRDKFVKNISESHRASGSGAKTTEDQWQYQSQMEFLREHIKPRKTVKSLSEESSPTEISDKNRSESVESMPETLFSEIKFVYDPLSPSISTTSPIEVASPSRKAMEEKLIEAIKNHEILYNKSSLFYGNKSKRAAAWSAISKEVNFPEDVCRTRWRCLRDKFVKNISGSHRASGSGAKTTEDQWKYQSQMEFLREHIKPRKTVKSLSKESSPTEVLEKNCSESVESMPETLFSEIKFVYDPLSPSISRIEDLSPSRKRSRCESDTEAFNEFLSKMTTSIAEARCSRTKSDPHNGFFGMVREMFDKMEPEVVENVKFHFLNYLHEQRTKM